MNKKEKTTETYNRAAKQMADKFRGLGSRVDDIEKVFSLSNKHNASVFEIGCGDGRDAKEIITRTDRYFGIDISSSMIEIAKEHAPKASFAVADLETFQFPANLDIIFSFASLLHSDQVAVKNVIQKAHKNLLKNGLFFISLKYDTYQSKTIEDEFGTRTYYYYMPSDIEAMTQDSFKSIFKEKQDFQKQTWFTLILQKI